MISARPASAPSAAALIGLLGCWTAPANEAQATESFWVTAGGDFYDPANWDGPVPDETVTAVFETEPSPWVTFGTDALSDRMVVRAGEVTLLLLSGPPAGPFSFDYELMNANVTTPSIVVGESPGDDAVLWINSGTLTAPNVAIGLAPGAAGTVRFTRFYDLPPGLICDSSLHVADAGEGHLVIEDGGQVSAGVAIVGAAQDSSGQVTVTAPDSQLSVADTLTVGKGGVGVLSIDNQADVASGSAQIGQQLPSTGEVTVTGAGATWIIDGSLDVGFQGDGFLTISDGLVVTNGFATIGTLPESTPDLDPQDGGTGDVTVSGLNALWSIGGTLYVGYTWSGSLQVLDGGAVTSQDGYIAFHYGSTGQATLQGTGSVWSTSGELTVSGTLDVSDGAFVIANPLRIESDGALDGDGSILGETISFGTIHPGAPFGTLAVEGNLSLDPASQLVIELSGPAAGSFDTVAVTGNAYAFGTIVVTLVDGFMPQSGDRFEILTADSLAAVLGPLTLPDLDPVLKWLVEQDGTSLELVVTSIADIDEDGIVSVTDFLALLDAWGACPGPPDPCPADLDGDGSVGVEDFLILLANWS